MPISPQQAYRLGSMPYRILREFRLSKWPETEFDDLQPMIELLAEWQELLRGVRDKTLLPDLIACKKKVETKAAKIKKQKREDRLERAARFVQGNVDGGPPKHAFSEDRAAVMELFESLAEKAENPPIGQKVPEVVRDVYRLGQLVSQCRASGGADEEQTADIWEIACRWVSADRLTGRPGGGFGPHESIHRIVLNRLQLIDELFSRHDCPLLAPQPVSADRLKTAVSAEDIAQTVTRHIDPRFQQVRDDIADYASASLADTAQTQDESCNVRLMTPNEAAKEFDVGAETLRREYRAGRIRGRRIGKHIKLERGSVIEWCRGEDAQAQSARTGVERQLPAKPRGRSPRRRV